MASVTVTLGVTMLLVAVIAVTVFGASIRIVPAARPEALHASLRALPSVRHSPVTRPAFPATGLPLPSSEPQSYTAIPNPSEVSSRVALSCTATNWPFFGVSAPVGHFAFSVIDSTVTTAFARPRVWERSVGEPTWSVTGASDFQVVVGDGSALDVSTVTPGGALRAHDAIATVHTTARAAAGKARMGSFCGPSPAPGRRTRRVWATNGLMLYATQARVHLDHIVANLEAVRAHVGERAVLLAIKANAYGHGAVPVARAVEASGAADWFGVATVPEGVELREAGVTLPILKLSPAFEPELEAAVSARLVLTVVDEAGVMAAERAATRVGKAAEVHVKIDTGMRRIGVQPERAAALAGLAEAQPHLRLTGVFTHFAASDDPSQDAFTASQLARFRTAVDEVVAQLGRELPYVHAANSGGVLAHPESWGTLVRPGIMAYGHYPDPATPRTVELLPGMTWASRVSFVKRVAEGETVSYGRTWTAPRDTTVATVPVGYGDGFSRLNSNRGHMLVRGRRYPIAGRVCMDQTMIDVGDDEVAVGDEVVLVGSQGDETITATEVAEVMGTIPYEVTCLVAPRVTRLYD